MHLINAIVSMSAVGAKASLLPHLTTRDTSARSVLRLRKIEVQVGAALIWCNLTDLSTRTVMGWPCLRLGRLSQTTQASTAQLLHPRQQSLLHRDSGQSYHAHGGTFQAGNKAATALVSHHIRDGAHPEAGSTHTPIVIRRMMFTRQLSLYLLLSVNLLARGLT